MSAVVSPTTATRTPIAGLLAVGLAVLAAAMIAAAHLARPDLDPAWVPISDLALGANSWVMTSAFLAWGAAGAAAVMALRPHVVGRWGTVGLVLLALGACGPLIAALFPADPVTAPGVTASWHGTAHGVGALLSDALLPATLILTVNLTRPGRALRAVRPFLIAASTVVWLAAIFLTTQMARYLAEPGAALGPDTPVGWVNRVHVLACVLVFAVFGYAARKQTAAVARR